MTNLLEQAINCNDGDLAAKIIRDALGTKKEEKKSNTEVDRSDVKPPSPL